MSHVLVVRVLRRIAYAWLVVVAAVVLVSYGVILWTEGLWAFWSVASPFNMWNTLLIFLVAAPGIALLYWAERKSNGRSAR